MKKLNTIATGLISGLLLPVLVFMILYYGKISDIGSALFLQYFSLLSVIPLLISHCILPNLILFFILNATNQAQAAKGVVIITVILTVGVFIVKIISGVI